MLSKLKLLNYLNFGKDNKFYDDIFDVLQLHEGNKLNLGCGLKYWDGWENWDIIESVKADKYLDFSKDIFPADDEKFQYIYCNGVLEQILFNDDFKHCLNECHRILKPGGSMVVIVPNATYPIAFRDPNDCRHMTPETFRYFCKGMKSYERYGKMYGFKPWNSFKCDTNSRGLMTVILEK